MIPEERRTTGMNISSARLVAACLLALALIPGSPRAATTNTIAGTGVPAYNADGISAVSAAINLPHGIVIDGSGTVFFADRGNHRVRKIDAASRVVTTVAGTGVAGFSGDGGDAKVAQVSTPADVALDGAGNLFIADEQNHRIRRVDAATGIITTVAGLGSFGYNGDGISATLAQLSSPSGVALDRDGNLFIADSGNSRIRAVEMATGMVETVAGTGVAGYSGDGGVASAAQISIISAHCGIGFDASGNLYIPDSGNHRVRKVNGVTGRIGSVAGTGATIYNGDGITALSAQLGAPTGVAFDRCGNLLFTDSSQMRIRMVDSIAGIITTIAGTGGTIYAGEGIDPALAQLSGLQDIALDPAENMIITDANRVRKVAPSTANVLATAVSTSSTMAGMAQAVVVRMTVTNTGVANVTGITPAMFVISGSSLVFLAQGPSPATLASLAPGSAQTFEWTYRVSGGGAVTFKCRVSGAVCPSNILYGEGTASLAAYFDYSAEGRAWIVGGLRGYINLQRGESATIMVKPAANGRFRARIYDMAGGLVWDRSITARASATEVIQWDGKDSTGNAVPPGLYPVLVEAPGVNYRDKLAVVR